MLILIIAFVYKRESVLVSTFINDELATLARATRVVIRFIFVLGPSALGMGESYLWGTPVEPLKATLYDHLGIFVYSIYFIFI